MANYAVVKTPIIGLWWTQELFHFKGTVAREMLLN